MAKIYVSSTIADLQEERRAVMEWLVTAGHQPVHSYRPNSESVRESCLHDIDGCDLYVLIFGHRYGSQPEKDNPENLSITHLEFRRAGQSGIPRIALLRTSVPDIGLSDLLNPLRAELARRFDEEVRNALRPAEFRNPQQLIQGLSTGVQSELEKLNERRNSTGREIKPDDPQVLKIVTTLTQVIEESRAENLILRGRVNELEEQLHAAVYRTLKAAGQPNADEAEIAAAQALEAGDTRPAEALLSQQGEKEAAQIGASGKQDTLQRGKVAELAREQGALAMGHDVLAALTAFERAAEYDPESAWTFFLIGDLRVLMGNLNSGMHAYRQGYVLSEALATRDPANTEWQRDLSVSHNRIGDVLVAQGDGNGALAAYRKGLAIREALATRDPANTQWQRDLSVSHNKIGDVLVAQGDGNGALAAYRKGLAIAEALATRDPANTEWQHDLSVSYDRIGDVLVAQGDGNGALAAYRKGLAIREALATRDPANTQWQRDLSVSYDKIGNMLVAQSEGNGALAAYRKGFAIREALATRDSANTEWQRDLSVSHNRIGDVLVAQGDGNGALAAYRKGLAIAEALATRDPANTEWQTDLAVSCAKLGQLKCGEGGDRCRSYLLRGRRILAQLKEQGRLHPNQDWIKWFDDQLAEISSEQAKGKGT